MDPTLARKLTAEAVGTGLLVAIVVGSGILASRLSPDDTGLQLLENSTATAGGLVALILAFGSVSGAHFNPIVSLADRIFEVIAVSAMADFDGQPGGLAATPSVCYPEELDDHFATFSNYGAPVDIAAPGVCVTSTYPGSQYGLGDGTSFSTPFVAGAAALYMSTHPNARPAKVRDALVARAEPGPILGDPDTYPEGVLNVRGL